MNKEYNLKLDLQFRCNNSKMIFDEFDENTSDFFMQITRQGKEIDASNAIPTLLVLKPSGTAVSQILNVKDNFIYGNLENSLKNEVGTYIAKLMLVEGDKKTFISNISYEVTENALLGKIDNDIVEDERYSILIQLLERLSNIELQEQTRIDNENSRIEAEKLREEAIKKVKNDIANLINETNKKVDNNLNTNTSKIDNLVIETKEELNKYKSNKDISIDEDLKEFKENTNKSIQDYKTSKDIEIDNALNTYKTNITNDINNFKNTVNSKIDKYKNDKDKVINEYIEAKSLELNNYVEAKSKEIDEYKTSKNNELDLYVSEKNTLINSKISEVDTAKEQLQSSVNSKLIEVDNAETQRQEEHESRQQFLDGFEGKLNTVVDDVAGVKDDVISVREANKRQDVFLQGLYNENLDGRVTIKEEGSVISLTNSDNGLVDIVGLEGNTLVNYVQDGAKELTLNGDIDVEGTNVTATEGADNGLVDVVCEGNTLVNLWDLDQTIVNGQTYREGTHIKTITTTNIYSNFFLEGKERIKPTTNYTLIAFVYKNTLTSRCKVYLTSYSGSSSSSSDVFTSNASQQKVINGGEIGIFKFLLTSKSDFTVSDFAVRGFVSNQGQIPDCELDMQLMLLEGDWTNKEIPPYFEGMKSVGECEDNKIEISSVNENLLDLSTIEPKMGEFTGQGGSKPTSYTLLKNGVAITSSTNYTGVMFRCKLKRNHTYTTSWDGVNAGRLLVKPITPNNIYQYNGTINALSKTPCTFTTTNSDEYWFIFDNYDFIGDWSITNIMLVEGTSAKPYTPHQSDKKEISLNEPLRALPSGVKDKVVKIGGKHYVERNCEEIVLDGSENWRFENSGLYYFLTKDEFKGASQKVNGSVISDNIKNSWDAIDCIRLGSSYPIQIAKKVCSSKEDFKQWLSENPTTVIYELQAPIYEELPTDPTLSTYNDITHISNNSTIPCNMKVANTGYNTIIKPSTQYTVALDTDKTGEVGINLGGSKVTTTNNVATVTTPSTLVDDTLRLTGKGIKASKVRLFEGDKTNWIPSFFEGMKSSFEDKLQDDGSYKMEILSNNKNLFDIENFLKTQTDKPLTKLTPLDTGFNMKNIPNQAWSVCYCAIKLKPNTRYKISFTSDSRGSNNNSSFKMYNKTSLFFDQSFPSGITTYNKTFTTDNYGEVAIQLNPTRGIAEIGDVDITNLLIQEYSNNDTDYIKPKQNKIQFSSIEPLRGVGDVKDRFVFKDGKLIIERNVKCELLNGSEGISDNGGRWSKYPGGGDHKLSSVFVLSNTPKIIGYGTSICNKFANTKNSNPFSPEKLKEFTYCDHPLYTNVYFNYGKNEKVTIEEWLEYLQENPINLIYQLANPIYEEVPFELQKIILEGYLNGTLFFDTNIPPTVTASYTANIPVVSKLNKVNETTETNTEDIAITQMAVDFLLMSTLGEEMLNFKVKSGYNMASYFANRIIKGALKYEDVINKYPQYKEDINSILISEGHSDLIIGL